MSATRPRVPKPIWSFWSLALAVIVVVRYILDVEVGIMNAITLGLLLFLVAPVTFGWFVFLSGWPQRIRYVTACTLVLALLGLAALYEFDGYRGDMMPIFTSRFAASVDSIPEVAEPGTMAIDVLSTTPYDFPGFLGANRDLRIDNVVLATDWEAEPPELLWRQQIGAGWSGFAVVNGFAATLEERDGLELVTLYDARTGAQLWQRHIGGEYDNVLGGRGPRSTPTIDSGNVYVLGVSGNLVALDGATGDLLWEHDLLAEYGVSDAEESAAMTHGRAGSPLIVRHMLITGVGGSRARRVSVAAYDKHSGVLLWEAGDHQAGMASPRLAHLAGREQVLLVNQNVVSGHDPETGAVLWEFDWPGISSADSNVSQAVPVEPNRVFISKGYGGGAALYELDPEPGGRFTARQLWHEPRLLRTKLTNVAMRDGYAYGLSEGILECVEVATGERAWKAGRYHHGQILLVGEALLVLTEDGELVMVEASPENRNNVLGRFQAINGHTWNNFALYGDILLVRNAQESAAYRLPVAGGSELIAAR